MTQEQYDKAVKFRSDIRELIFQSESLNSAMERIKTCDDLRYKRDEIMEILLYEVNSAKLWLLETAQRAAWQLKLKREALEEEFEKL
jgi:hypothetical protein